MNLQEVSIYPIPSKVQNISIGIKTVILIEY